MPEIYIPKRKKKTYPKRNKNKEIAHIYNKQEWVKLRAAYMAAHPICERCLELYDKVSPTQEIHHIVPISSGNSIQEMEDIAYNPDNLMALCTQCHHEIHQEMKNKKKKKL